MNASNFLSYSGRSRAGFTLIELLTVIAIIGILAGILIPTVSAVKTSANKSRTKVQFSQWASAAELFKAEYGFYPRLAQSTGSGRLNPTNFLANLTARDYSGTALTTSSALVDNKRKMSFYSPSDNEIAKNSSGTSQNIVIDAFGNSDIMVMIDGNNDGMLSGGELKTEKLAGGNSTDPSSQSGVLSSGSVDNPTSVRAGVAFYSAGRNNTITDYVYTWK